MKLPLCAGLALCVATALGADPMCPGTCEPTQVCRFKVNSDGATCHPTEGECVAKVTVGGACTGGTAAACFADECIDSTCQLRKLGEQTLTVGVCTKTCVWPPGGMEVVYTGWKGTDMEPTKWCHTVRCDATGTIVYDVPLEMDRPDCGAVDLKCCEVEPVVAGVTPPVKKCCGTTRLWVEANKDTTKFTCADVESTDGGAAPFSKSCDDDTLKCGDKPEGWTGLGNGEDAKWCQLCRCTAGAFVCETKTCLTAAELKCCPSEKPDMMKTWACCGATGEWVALDDTTNVYTCAGVTAAAATALPFYTGPTHTCVAPVDKCQVTFPMDPMDALILDDGDETHHRGDGRWCNTCKCTKGKLACTNERCPPLKCCPAPMMGDGPVCCGVDGTWLADGVACANVKSTAETIVLPPFKLECVVTPPVMCAVDAMITGAPTVEIALGTTVKKGTGLWCDTCTCGAGPAITCTTATVCPTVRCCPPAAAGGPTDLKCCGTTGTWVAVDAVSGEAKCAGGVGSFAVPMAAPLDPFSHACATCALPGGTVVASGWAGFDTGADGWCNKCTCTDSAVVCTTFGCAARLLCCTTSDKPMTGTPECCGVTGLWVQPNAGGEYACGVAAVAAGTLPLHTVECKTCGGVKVGGTTPAPTEPENWCKTCTCVADAMGTPTSVCTPAAACPVKAVLKCCREADKGMDGEICCGVTGLWQKFADACGGVVRDAPMGMDLPTAPFNEPCKRCAVDGEMVEIGWSGYVPGDKWCHLAYCTAGSTLVYRAATPCPALKCCSGTAPGGSKCCGATGDWVAVSAAPNAGKFACGLGGMHTTTLAPIREAAGAECATCSFATVGLPAGTVDKPVGWFGDVECNICYCAPGPTKLCTTSTCTPKPAPAP